MTPCLTGDRTTTSARSLRAAAAAWLFAAAALAAGIVAEPVRAASRPEADSVPAADVASAEKLRDRALAGTEAFATVRDLTTDVGQRIAGSAADRAAVRWAVARMTAMGLINVHTEPVTVPHWVRGTASLTVHGDPLRSLVVASLGGTPGTDDAGVTAAVVFIADFKALSALPEGALAGKIAYVGNRMRASRDHDGYGEAVVARNQGPAVASNKGAVAFLVRSIGTDHNRLAHTGRTDFAGTTRPIPALALSAPDADFLERRLASPAPVEVTLQSSARSLPPEQSANVVGELAGDGSLPGIVLLGAHLDSWDLGEGAIDDGAGVGIVLATVRTMRAANLTPHRTIRVVLFADEEQGGAGAAVHDAGVTARHERIVAAMEADSGAARVIELKCGPEAGAIAMPLRRILKPLGAAYTSGPAHGGADLRLLHEHGTPLVDLLQDQTSYFDIHHTANDVLGVISGADLDQAVAAFAASSWLLAAAPGLGPAAVVN